MANSPFYKGWLHDAVNSRLAALYNGTEVFDFDANDMVITPATTVTGALTASSTVSITGLLTLAAGTRLGAASASKLGLGALEEPTIATGVLTVTKPFVNPLPESGTTDTVDSITYTGAAEGDLLFIHVPATNTITFDDANINLAAATRAVAPGGSLLLVFDGTEWTEVVFLAGSDNV